MSAVDATPPRAERSPASPADKRSAPPATDDAGARKGRQPARARRFLVSLGKTAATLAIVGLALLAGLLIWTYYIVAPWTRDGRVRVQVASVAPQVSGQITELRVVDNQYVQKGDTLYVIDPFDFKVSLDQAKTQLLMKAADLEVKKRQSQRRQSLSDLATTAEEQQQYAGSAAQAQAAYDAAQSQVSQAQVNLARTQVKSPVNGYVTNLLMRVGDFAHEGTSNISVIDADSYWVDGYFEETKLAHVCIGDLAEARLMGYSRPILGRVQTVTRGISVSDAAPSTQGLPNVDPVYTWVRLAQRVPVRVAITTVPAGIPLVSGLTATVTIRDAEAREGSGWWSQRWAELHQTAGTLFHRPDPNPDCIPAIGTHTGPVQTLPSPEPAAAPNPSSVVPGLAPGLTQSPR